MRVESERKPGARLRRVQLFLITWAIAGDRPEQVASYGIPR